MHCWLCEEESILGAVLCGRVVYKDGLLFFWAVGTSIVERQS